MRPPGPPSRAEAAISSYSSSRAPGQASEGARPASRPPVPTGRHATLPTRRGAVRWGDVTPVQRPILLSRQLPGAGAGFVRTIGE